MHLSHKKVGLCLYNQSDMEVIVPAWQEGKDLLPKIKELYSPDRIIWQKERSIFWADIRYFKTPVRMRFHLLSSLITTGGNSIRGTRGVVLLYPSIEMEDVNPEIEKLIHYTNVRHKTWLK